MHLHFNCLETGVRFIPDPIFDMQHMIYIYIYEMYMYFQNCIGQQINLPPGGKMQTFLTGSTVRLKWNYTNVAKVQFRAWTFTSSDGKFSDTILASINGDKNAVIEPEGLDVDIEKPATLILKSVNITYNGTYQFFLTPVGDSMVYVFIAGKFSEF